MPLCLVLRVSTVKLENCWHDIQYYNFVQAAHVKIALCHLSGYTGHLGYLASVFLMCSKWILSCTQTTFEWIHLEQL